MDFFFAFLGLLWLSYKIGKNDKNRGYFTVMIIIIIIGVIGALAAK